MRKSLIMLSFVLTAFFSYAGTGFVSGNALQVGGKHYFNAPVFQKNKLINVNSLPGRFACTVNITASVGYSATYISATCSSTKSTCDAAIAEAAGCVKSALATAKKAIK